jgi:hypothetical protein
MKKKIVVMLKHYKKMWWKKKKRLSRIFKHLNVNIMGLLILTFDWFLKKLVVAKFKVKNIF